MTGTIFENTHLDIRMWLYAINLVTIAKKGTSALQLQRELGIGSYKCAWRMMQKIRTAISNENMKEVFEVDVRSITTAKEQKLYLDGADAALMKGKKILIVDDVISTGESLSALEALVEKAGGVVCGKMAVLAEGDAQDREDLIYLEKLPLFNPDGTIMG